MNQKNKNEITGRLWLWANSVNTTKHLLNLAIKHKDMWDKLNQKEIVSNHETLNPVEYIAAHDAFIELSIVYFSQIFNRGDGRYREIADNTKHFIEEHFSTILSRVFEIEEKANKFEVLKQQIITARNQMIGHSDAECHSIQHSQISVLTSKNLWINIDLSFWLSFLDKMHHEIHCYCSEIKLQ